MIRSNLPALCGPLRLTSTLVVLLFSVSVNSTLIGQQVAVKGGRIIPIVGDPIENGVILIRDGKIIKVGKDLNIPIDATVIDASGKVVMPGFVEVHSSAAMSQANEQNPNVPFLSVVDSIDPARSYFEEARRNGVTTVAVTPGNSTMIGGQSAVIKTAGGFVESMILKRHAGLKISLRPTSGASRMSHYAKLRTELEKAKRSLEDEEKKRAADTTTDSSDESIKRTALQKLLRGELQAIVYCENAMDVAQALKLGVQYKWQSLLVLGRDCDRAVELVAKNKLAVVLDSTLVFWRTDPRSGEDEKIVVPAIYRDKHVPFVFQTSSSSGLGSRFLWYQAAIAVKYGMPVDEALEALTLQPAKLLGVDQFVGSIEVGKDADLIILSGDPLKVSTWVEKTIVNGKLVYEREKDTKLKKLLAPK